MESGRPKKGHEPWEREEKAKYCLGSRAAQKCGAIHPWEKTGGAHCEWKRG